jgi:predicted RNA-binding Zn ribbon-like protein
MVYRRLAVKIIEIAQPRIFQLIAAHPILDFINTLDWRFRETGSEELLETYPDLVHFTEQSGLLAHDQAQTLSRTATKRKAAKVLEASRELREALAEATYSIVDRHVPSVTQLKTLERHFQSARLHQKLRWTDSFAQWSLAEVADAPELPLWLLALSAADLLTSDALSTLRACDNLECRWLFLDTSKNHTKRWCDMKICGNRMKARRFKAREHPAPLRRKPLTQ